MNRTAAYVILFAVLVFAALKALDPDSPGRELLIFGLLMVMQSLALVVFDRPKSSSSWNLVLLFLLPTMVGLAAAGFRAAGWLEIDRLWIWIIFGISACAAMARALFVEARAGSLR